MNKVFFSSLSNEWETPDYIFNELNKEFNFTLDPCSNDYNYKVIKHYTLKENGLVQSWKNEVVFCNPPYNREISKWVKKSVFESKYNNALVVMLIPSRTDTSYFHDYILPYSCEIRYIRGRLKFMLNGVIQNSAPFPSMIVIFNRGGSL